MPVRWFHIRKTFEQLVDKRSSPCSEARLLRGQGRRFAVLNERAEGASGRGGRGSAGAAERAHSGTSGAPGPTRDVFGRSRGALTDPRKFVTAPHRASG